MNLGERQSILDEITADYPPQRKMGEDGKPLGLTAYEFSDEINLSYDAARGRLKKLVVEKTLESRKEINFDGHSTIVYYKKGEVPT